MQNKKQPEIKSTDPNDFSDSPPGTDMGETIVGTNNPGEQKGGKHSGVKKSNQDTIPQIGSMEDDERSLDENE